MRYELGLLFWCRQWMCCRTVQTVQTSELLFSSIRRQRPEGVVKQWITDVFTFASLPFTPLCTGLRLAVLLKRFIKDCYMHWTAATE